MDTSNDDTATESVLPPPMDASRTYRRLWWALPLLTLSALLVIAIIASGSMVIDQWETAPGEAEPVADRIIVTDATRYPAANKVMFVSAYGTRLTALESLIGWIDPDVDVQGKNERFGSISPSDQRQIGFQDMLTSKQIAEFVALKTLGYTVSIDEGAVVVADLVCDDAPTADSACKLLKVGDTLVAVDDVKTPTLTALAKAVAGHKTGDVIKVTVVHEGSETSEDVNIRMMSNPSDPTRTIIGFVPSDTRTVNLPFHVDITTAAIGGPSAGLAFTLAIIDELSPGELLGNTKVAVTGTMSDDGTVGPIGALQQKAVAVKRAGAKVFLVPDGQSDKDIKDAQRAVGDGLRIIKVKSLDDALKVLEDLGGEPLIKVNSTN